MNHDDYQAWQESHRLPPNSIDLADDVMQKITQKASGPGVLQWNQAWEVALLDRLQARVSAQAGVLCLGALLGLVRLFFQMASLLFT